MNPIQATCGCDAFNSDAFVTKLNPSGAPVFSTYLGGRYIDNRHSLAVDSQHNVYVGGDTGSDNFPLVNALQTTNPNGGGFITKINAAGTDFVYSTHFGGQGFDRVDGIGVDSTGAAYVTGQTNSANFPTVGAIQGTDAGGNDAFVSKISPSGTSIVYSTYLGGAASEEGFAVAVDRAHNAYVTGTTSSTNFPTANAIQPTEAGGSDVFVSKINAAGSAFVYSTYLGGSGGETGYLGRSGRVRQRLCDRQHVVHQLPHSLPYPAELRRGRK